jgi:hypothetical protein
MHGFRGRRLPVSMWALRDCACQSVTNRFTELRDIKTFSN